MNGISLVLTGLIISIPLWIMGLGILSLAESARGKKEKKND